MYKVCFLIPSLSSGGIETYLLRFLKLKKTEIEATVLVRGKNTGDLVNEYKSLGLPILFMPLGYVNPLKWRQYYCFFKQNNFDTICDFNANFAGIPMLIAKLAGIKNRITFYRQGKDHFKTSLTKRIYNRLMNWLVFKFSAKILANSKSGLDYFFPYRKPNDHRFKIISNGIDFAQFQKKVNKDAYKQSLGIPENAFIIGHTGRLDKAKNHDTILKVANTLINKDPNVYLVLCGNNTEKLADKVARLRISNNVRLLGYRSDIQVLLHVFDLFYFPSITEGQPNSLLEAMAAGVTIIASNIEPVREIFPDKSMLFNPCETEDVICKIEQIKDKCKILYNEDLANYTKANFNADQRFNEFLIELMQTT